MCYGGRDTSSGATGSITDTTTYDILSCNVTPDVDGLLVMMGSFRVRNETGTLAVSEAYLLKATTNVGRGYWTIDANHYATPTLVGFSTCTAGTTYTCKMQFKPGETGTWQYGYDGYLVVLCLNI